MSTFKKQLYAKLDARYIYTLNFEQEIIWAKMPSKTRLQALLQAYLIRKSTNSLDILVLIDTKGVKTRFCKAFDGSKSVTFLERKSRINDGKKCL